MAVRNDGAGARYRRLPTGAHGLDPETVKLDQRGRLQSALIELISEKGYQAVRIIDLAKRAHVSQPSFYALYADKEQLFLSTYEQIAQRAGRRVTAALEQGGSESSRELAAMRSFAELAVEEPGAMSLLILGAFGAGGSALERRREMLDRLEAAILAMRGVVVRAGQTDLTIKALLGGVREVTATRLREERQRELPALTDEIAAWVACYPPELPDGLVVPSASGASDRLAGTSERARQAEGPLPSGRSDLPRQFIVKSQRERIVDATAAIVAESGLAALTVPAIAKRASVSLQTFYSIYKSKHEAFLGAQKVGLHQALGVAASAYEAHAADWPTAVAAGLRALLDYQASEPAHAHLTLVDTHAASPAAIEIRSAALSGFARYLSPGFEIAAPARAVPSISSEAIAGGIWQVLHHYAENRCVAELPSAAPQLTYFALAPFLGAEQAAAVARRPAPAA